MKAVRQARGKEWIFFHRMQSDTHATELVLDSPGFCWLSYHLLDNSRSHVAD